MSFAPSGLWLEIVSGGLRHPANNVSSLWDCDMIGVYIRQLLLLGFYKLELKI
jgi:hypothetical protein